MGTAHKTNATSSIKVIASSLQQHQERPQLEPQTTMMVDQEQSVLAERRQIDALMENTSDHRQGENEAAVQCFVPISPVASMNNLVIHDDSITGCTEVQLSQRQMSTPPASPVNRLSSSRHSETITGSCQRRGRFLVWPVSTSSSAVVASSPSSESS